MMKLFCLMIAGLGLASCSLASRVPDYPPLEATGFSDREWTDKEKLLARSDFSVEIIRFTDNRNPRVEATDPYDNVIYDYDADQLVQGVTQRVPVLFNKYLAYRPRQAKHYRIEIEITRLKARVLPGTIWDGQFGRYSADVEVRVIGRRSDSTVVMNRPYSLQIEKRRTTFNGRSPSADMDRNRMYDLVEDNVRRLSESIGWDLRRMDAHAWDVPATSVLPPAEAVTPSVPEIPAGASDGQS